MKIELTSTPLKDVRKHVTYQFEAFIWNFSIEALNLKLEK